MISDSLRQRLENNADVPTIPATASAVLESIDNPNTGAGTLAKLIERDMALTSRVLSVANSPFYGLQRKVATVELAVVILGLSAIKEILLSLVVKRLFARIKTQLLDVQQFWDYSVYCGTAARHLARKLRYRVTGEAFVAGLIHDVGIVLEAQFLPKEFTQIREIQQQEQCSLLEAEQKVLGTNHCEIGLWFAERWNLPAQLRSAVQFHHRAEWQQNGEGDDARILTGLVGLAEFFALNAGQRNWANDYAPTPLYTPEDLLTEIRKTFRLDDEDALNQFLDILHIEFLNASDFT